MPTAALTRKLTLRQASQETQITVTIDWPQWSPNRECWECTLVCPPLFSKPMVLCGEDGFQALLLSLKFLRCEIQCLQKSGDVVYGLEPGDEGRLTTS